jgi:hypothetical protein
MGRGNQPEEKDRESMRRGSTDDILEPDRGHSDLVNEAVNLTVAEDADDLAAFKDKGDRAGSAVRISGRDLKERG